MVKQGSSKDESRSETEFVDANKKSLHESLRESAMWGEIRRMAETNAAMREYTDKCIELYHLLRKHR